MKIVCIYFIFSICKVWLPPFPWQPIFLLSLHICCSSTNFVWLHTMCQLGLHPNSTRVVVSPFVVLTPLFHSPTMIHMVNFHSHNDSHGEFPFPQGSTWLICMNHLNIQSHWLELQSHGSVLTDDTHDDGVLHWWWCSLPFAITCGLLCSSLLLVGTCALTSDGCWCLCSDFCPCKSDLLTVTVLTLTMIEYSF